MHATTWSARTKRTNVALLRVAAGAMLISFSPVFVRVAHVGPTTAAFYRMLFGGVGLAVLVALRGTRVWGGARHVWLAGLCGLVVSLDLAIWHRSIHYVGPGLATILGNFQIFFVAGFGILWLKERLSWRLAFAIPLAILGLFLVFGLEWDTLEETYRLGAILGIFTALLYAVFLLLLRKIQVEHETLSPIGTLLIVSVVSAAVLGPISPAIGESLRIPDASTWAALIGYGLVSQIIGWILITGGLSRIPVSRAGLLLLLQPALAFIWDVLFFNRGMTTIEIAGVLLALAAIYLGSGWQSDSRVVR